MTFTTNDPVSLGIGSVSRETDSELQVRLVDYGDEFWIPNDAFHETSEVKPVVRIEDRLERSGQVVVKNWWYVKASAP